MLALSRSRDAVEKLIVVFLIFTCKGVLANNENPALSEEGLFLFLSENQQKIEEEKYSSAENEAFKPGATEPTVQTNSNVLTDAETVSVPEPQPASEQTLERYNGAVLRGSEVLGVWIDGRKYVASQNSASPTIEQLGQNGVVRFSTSQGAVVLAPGDFIPSQLSIELQGLGLASHSMEKITADVAQ